MSIEINIDQCKAFSEKARSDAYFDSMSDEFWLRLGPVRGDIDELVTLSEADL